jgi:GT2 family glycosyltransferase
VKTPDIDIVIPVHNAIDLVTTCLDSVENSRDASRHRLILVDDGSDNLTASALREHAVQNPGVELLRNEDPGGFTKAANRGLRHSSAEMVIVLNSDTEVPTNWLSKIAQALFSVPGVGVVGPLSNAASHQSIPRSEANLSERSRRQTARNALPPGMSLESANAYLETISWPGPVRVPLVHGFCFAVKKEVLRTVGYFDEVLFPEGFGEENDYCLRASDAGWGLALAVDTYVWHEKTGSYDVERRARLVEQSKGVLTAKYGKPRIRCVTAAMKDASEWLALKTQGLQSRASLSEN